MKIFFVFKVIQKSDRWGVIYCIIKFYVLVLSKEISIEMSFYMYSYLLYYIIFVIKFFYDLGFVF